MTEVGEWQAARYQGAIASLDRGEGASHDEVKDWVASWGGTNEKRRAQKIMTPRPVPAGLAALRANIEPDDQCAATLADE